MAITVPPLIDNRLSRCPLGIPHKNFHTVPKRARSALWARAPMAAAMRARTHHHGLRARTIRKQHIPTMRVDDLIGHTLGCSRMATDGAHAGPVPQLAVGSWCFHCFGPLINIFHFIRVSI